jgi:hypothetical protein
MASTTSETEESALGAAAIPACVVGYCRAHGITTDMPYIRTEISIAG